MNTCCEKCRESLSDNYCCLPECRCHQEKPNHEIGWEEIEERVSINHTDWPWIKAAIQSLLTHQKRELQAEHLKDISQHRRGAFKHGRSVGIKETKESILSKLEGLKVGEPYIIGSQTTQEAQSYNKQIEGKEGYNQGIADAVEVVKSIQ